jgi:hypothetical protein
MALPFHLTRTCAAAALIATLVLGGCGAGDGVELNGKVFDMVGLGQASGRVEPKLAPRPPLVLPPNASALPEPGSGQVAATGDVSWPTDPEQKKLADIKERERLHKAYCRGDIQWKEKALSTQGTMINTSPYGSCSSIGSILNSANKN